MNQRECALANKIPWKIQGLDSTLAHSFSAIELAPKALAISQEQRIKEEIERQRAERQVADRLLRKERLRQWEFERQARKEEKKRAAEIRKKIKEERRRAWFKSD